MSDERRQYEHINVGDLTSRDLGSRVLVTDGDTVVDGTLEGFWADFTYKRERRLNQLVVNTASGEFKLKQVPLDYVIQIDRTPAEEDA